MLSRNKIKYAQSLLRKKYRQKYNKIIVEGSKLCAEILTLGNVEIDEIFATRAFLDAHIIPRKHAGKLIEVDSREMGKISALSTPAPVLVICTPPDLSTQFHKDELQHTLYLDGIRDPGNIGTIIRTADWFGIDTLLLSEDCVEVFSPKVVQASMGSVFRVYCHQLEKNAFPEFAEGFTVLGADMDGDDLFQHSFPARSIVVLGNEGQGLSPEIVSVLNGKVSIPGSLRLGAESLNVAVTAGMIMARLQISGK